MPHALFTRSSTTARESINAFLTDWQKMGGGAHYILSLPLFCKTSVAIDSSLRSFDEGRIPPLAGVFIY